MNKKSRKALISENVAMALDVLLAHKLRSGLIILGVSIGVASLMGMVSILLGLEKMITEEITSAERTTIQVTKFDFMVGGVPDREEMLHRKDITEEDVEAIRAACPSLQYVSYLVEPMGGANTLRYGDEKSRMVQIAGVEPTLFNIYNFELDQGRMFTQQEVLHRAKVVVLGDSPRRDLFRNRDPIGKRIKIGTEDFTVIGTAMKRKSLFGDLSNNVALLPYTAYMAAFWKEGDARSAYGAVRDGASVEQAKDEVVRVMRIRRKLKANQPDNFAVVTSDAMLDFLNRITGPMAGILAAISSIGLLVGGIGVMNMMLVSVTERTGEIGIRKAVGATRQDILWQFLIESAVLTGLGGFLGTTVGLVAAYVISNLTGLPSSISVFYILVAVIFSVVIGIFFGLYPANRASKLDPVLAMNYAK
jgi:putative ABC transport system permease protein